MLFIKVISFYTLLNIFPLLQKAMVPFFTQNFALLSQIHTIHAGMPAVNQLIAVGEKCL